MVDSDELLREADQLLDENKFAEACDAYRRALIVGGFSGHAKSNLWVAQNEERLRFLRELSERYPEQIEFALAGAHELLAVGRPAHAVPLCAVLLERDISVKDRFLIRLLRLRAAARCGQFQHFVEDFRENWTAGAAVAGSERFRPGLLDVIAELTDIRAVSVLETLIKEPWVPNVLGKFLSAKVVELRALEHAKAEKLSEIEGNG